VGKPKSRRLETGEEDLKNMGARNWRCNKAENSGGKLWKKLRSTKDCTARRRTRRRRNKKVVKKNYVPIRNKI